MAPLPEQPWRGVYFLSTDNLLDLSCSRRSEMAQDTDKRPSVGTIHGAGASEGARAAALPPVGPRLPCVATDPRRPLGRRSGNCVWRNIQRHAWQRVTAASRTRF